jgi:long-chain acyl-CoA synthetase
VSDSTGATLRQTPSDWVANHARNTPDQIAIIDAETRLTYSELDTRVARMAARLEAGGVKAGDVVATLLPNSWEMIVVLVASLRRGAVVLPMNPQYKESEIESTIAGARPKAIFVSSTQVSIVEEVLARIDGDAVMCVGVPDGRGFWFSYESSSSSPEVSLEADATVDALPEFDGSEPALWLYSSGSTGGSKKISRSRVQLAAEALAFHKTARTRADDVFLCAVPLSHAHGFSNGLVAATYVGATLVVHDRFDRRRFFKSVECDRVTIVPGSPFMFKILAETKMDREPDLGSIRLCFTAGAPLTHGTYMACRERFGISIRQLYGSTETGAVSLNLSDDIDASWDSVGAPLAGVEIGAFDEDGRLLPAGEEGAIGITSPAMFDGYESDELNATALKGGRLFLGDRGRVDIDGRVYLTGRDTLFINLAGNKVDPAELEALLSKHPKVVESVALGTTQRGGNEVVKVVVVSNEPCEAGELLEFCRGRIADFKLPRIIEFRDEIPRNPLGKVLRKYLQ